MSRAKGWKTSREMSLKPAPRLCRRFAMRDRMPLDSEARAGLEPVISISRAALFMHDGSVDNSPPAPDQILEPYRYSIAKTPRDRRLLVPRFPRAGGRAVPGVR